MLANWGSIGKTNLNLWVEGIEDRKKSIVSLNSNKVNDNTDLKIIQKAIIENKGKIRTIPLNPSICKILLGWAKARGLTSGMIFATKHGTFIKNEQFSRAFKKIAGKLRYIKKDKVHPHSIRHLFARCILENDFKTIDKDGKPKEKNLDSKLVDLADILGHSRLETTRIYLRTSTKEKSKMINSMINNTIENKAFDSSKVKPKKRRKNK